MRAIFAILLAVAGCGSDMNVADMADMSVCSRGVGSPPSVSTQCGALTCAPGQICVAHQPGALPRPDLAQPVDAGGPEDGGAPIFDPYQHSCVTLPAECQQCGGCGDGTVGLPFGCFTKICDQYEDQVGCRFDGATLTCINQ